MSSYDVFLSHNSADKLALSEIADHLDRADVKSFFDERDLVAGELWQEELEEALERSVACAVFLGPAGLGPWQNEEMRASIELSVKKPDFRVIPVLLPGASKAKKKNLPSFLRRRTWVDLSTGINADTMEPLLRAIQGEKPRRSKSRSGPKLWAVPYSRNNSFQGREEILATLRRQVVENPSRVVCQAISGLGGIGKTQTAIEYAYRHEGDYEAVLWIGAENVEKIKADLVNIAGRLNLPGHEEDEIVASVMTWLELNDGWLLVYDNADEPTILLPYMPRRGHGHVLVTSRAERGHLSRALRITAPIELDTLEPADAVKFLLKRTAVGTAKRVEAGRVAKDLGYLPLALNQAAGWVLETGLSFADYQANFDARRPERLKRYQPMDYHATVATTWALNVERIRNGHPRLVGLLEACAFFAPHEIPIELALAAGWQGKEDHKKLMADRGRLVDLLKPLVRFSLVTRDMKNLTLGMHRLVQAVIADGLEAGDRKEWIMRCVAATSELFPWPKFETWKQCRRLQLHAMSALEHAEKEDLESDTVARLAGCLASFADDRAAYSEAEHLYQQSLAIKERALEDTQKVFDKARSSFAATLNNLGILYRKQGRYTEAEELYERSLGIYEKVLGDEHPEVAATLNNLAILHARRGRHEEAEPLYQIALRIRKRALGDEHPHVAQTLNNLGRLYASLGRSDEAESIYERSLAIYKKALGNEHPEVAGNLKNLGLLYTGLSRYAEAESLYEKSLAIYEKTLGHEHPEVAQMLTELGILYTHQGRYSEAEVHFERSLAIHQQALGDEHPRLATTLEKFADLFEKTTPEGRRAEINAMRQRASAIRNRRGPS